jgi:hypothetical protein
MKKVWIVVSHGMILGVFTSKTKANNYIAFRELEDYVEVLEEEVE